MKVRKEASDAGILVVNHHLLFADIESRMNGAGYEDAAVLPPYKRIVFDEAHGIEDSATSFLSETVTRFKLMKQVGLLYRTRRGSLTGLLVQLSALSMLNQASGDRQILAKQLNISPFQLSYVTNSNEGEGLLLYGNTIIPFKDKFDTSLKLYSLMTTKPNEMGKYKEKKEA